MYEGKPLLGEVGLHIIGKRPNTGSASERDG
ncbi:MAG: hypothetical protein DGJ47_000699 [Rickettsiaceae bacterium]